MLIRSYLYAPANRADLLDKVLTRGADAVVIDLEDAVPPSEKDAARAAAATFLGRLDPAASPPIYVRINAGERGLQDLGYLPLEKLAGVRVPKAEDAGVISRVDSVLARGESKGRRVAIHPMIETANGLFSVDQCAHASARVERFIFGAGDYVHDVGAQASPERVETLYARSYLVARSRFLGIAAPIAHVYTPIKDLDGLARACREDRALGFYGRSCIHPTQVQVINESFSFGQREIDRARAMVDGYLAATSGGRGAVVIADGTFVDEAGFKRAQRVLERATALEALKDG